MPKYPTVPPTDTLQLPQDPTTGWAWVYPSELRDTPGIPVPQKLVESALIARALGSPSGLIETWGGCVSLAAMVGISGDQARDALSGSVRTGRILLPELPKLRPGERHAARSKLRRTGYRLGPDLLPIHARLRAEKAKPAVSQVLARAYLVGELETYLRATGFQSPEDVDQIRLGFELLDLSGELRGVRMALGMAETVGVPA